jgi:hypothetical protein
MASQIPASSLAGGGGPVGEKSKGVRADLRVVSGLEMVARSGGSMERGGRRRSTPVLRRSAGVRARRPGR